MFGVPREIGLKFREIETIISFYSIIPVRVQFIRVAALELKFSI